MVPSIRSLGALISVVVAGSLSASDARSDLMKVAPVHVALNHPALLAGRAKPRIAFLQLTQTPSTASVVDQAIALLTKRGFDVLDRENIDRIIKEQKFHAGELVDLDQQVQLGKIMGVTDLVSVSSSASPGAFKVTYKAVDIMSARVLRAVKDTFADQKNAGKALAGFYVEWNEVYDLPLAPCTPLETSDYESLADTYQAIVQAYQNSMKLDALAQAAGSASTGSKYAYKAGGSTIFEVKAWSGDPEDSPRRNAHLVYEAYLEYQAGLLFLRQDKIDAALGHLQQADQKLDKAAWDGTDEMARGIAMAKNVAQRLKTQREEEE